MSLKNLNVIKTPKNLRLKLSNKKIQRLFKNFEKNFNIQEAFIVAVSGGPDSLALAFLTKIYSIQYNLKSRYFIVDHKLRKESTEEAKKVKKILNNFDIKAEILTWRGKKPSRNIQSLSRKKRYDLLFSKCKQLKISNLIVGHHLDDLFENFFIRILRGSGLQGLISLDRETQKNNINLIRPLINIDKDDLVYISNHVFGSYVQDPSNQNDKFKRVKVRNLLKELSLEGLDRNKFFLTIKNLKFANESIKFYTKKNIEENVTMLKKKQKAVLEENFFSQSEEVVFRSFGEVIKIIGKKYYTVRGRKIDKIINLVESNSSFKVTLGGCLIKKVNGTVILSKE